eukprot:TRINITY_DN31459_c0_g1_i1.p1 TRINITY_DN31459_c0_g1~~TRINITY_DN31459_c0_g1_i1.p1  ORF type:complete len:365 (+),score=54.71 TRINITY_DN31459_c0_g1_i1:104-1198(+)
MACSQKGQTTPGGGQAAPHVAGGGGSQQRFRVMWWNILVDVKSAGADVCEWNNRVEGICQRVREEQPDLIGFAEILPHQYRDIADRLGADFQGAHCADYGCGKESKYGGELGFFYRPKVFERGQVRGSSLGALCQREEEKAAWNPPKWAEPEGMVNIGDPAPEDWFALTADFLHRPSGRRVVFGVTHLRWEWSKLPPQPGGGGGAACASKPLHAEGVARMLHEHAEGVGAGSRILAGDFNTPYDSGADFGVYRLLTQAELGEADPGHPSRVAGQQWQIPRPLTNPCPMKSAYKEVAGSEPAFTRKKGTPESEYCLDYMFYAGNIRPAQVGPMPQSARSGSGGTPFLPCVEWPSDHIRLLVEFEL